MSNAYEKAKNVENLQERLNVYVAALNEECPDYACKWDMEFFNSGLGMYLYLENRTYGRFSLRVYVTTYSSKMETVLEFDHQVSNYTENGDEFHELYSVEHELEKLFPKTM